MPVVVAVLMVIGLFFLSLLSFVTSPFETLATAPAEGRGLNPLLQNFYMQIHPPLLYLGYVGLSIPFAFAIAALVTRKLDTGWISSIRRWTIFSWLFLGIGILLGAKWAYETLGWGGYWAWDPVENAAFMPWLVATAFLHSVMVQERRGHAEGLEHGAGLPDLQPLPLRHLPDPLRDHLLGPRLRRVDPGAVLPRPSSSPCWSARSRCW